MQKKLRETKFFLCLICSPSAARKLESEELEFYLSAFLTAGRSVVGFFQNKKDRKKMNWFSKWKNALQANDRQLLNDMTNLRDAEVHEAGASVSADVEMVPLLRYPIGPQAPLVYGANEGDVPPSEIGVKVCYFQLHGKQREVKSTCRRYVELLEKLVQDFDQLGACD